MCNTACSVLRVSEGFVSSLREVTMLSHPQAASSQTWLSGTCLTCPPSPSTRRAPRCRLPGRRCQPPPQLSCKIKNKNNVWLLFYSILCFIPKRHRTHRFSFRFYSLSVTAKKEFDNIFNSKNSTLSMFYYKVRYIFTQHTSTLVQQQTFV